MPTPIGHLLAGAAVYAAQRNRKNIHLLLFVLFFALLPDIDFIFGFVVNDPNRYHHLFTHSFFFVVLAGITGAIIYSKWRHANIFISSAIFVSAGISHVILDCLALDRREPFGCPIWWPVSQEFFISPLLIFSDVSRSSESGTFFQSLFNVHNIRTVSIEILVLLPVFVFVWLLNVKRRSKNKTVVTQK